MFAVVPNSLSLLVINVLFASIALALGVGIGAWLFGSRRDGDQDSDALDSDYRRAAERAMMASQRIKDLAAGMVSDVGAHQTQVEAMAADLKSLAEGGAGGVDNHAVFTAVGRMVEANSQLQQRLSNAETQLKNQAAELRTYESAARTDSLTGLANRRAFDDELSRRFSEWARHKTTFTLLILDIDHFKQFNDSHGHQAGDEILRNVGNVLVETARQSDLPCRYGGEEFAVILPATPISEAKLAAERFRTAINASASEFNGKRLSVTSSIGLAQVRDREGATHLIRRADEALYKSKEAGRNCGHWHDGNQCLPIAALTPTEPAPPPKAADEPQPPAAAGLLNDGTFVDVLQRRVTESHRFGLPLSVLYLKVENYQLLTQEYGKSTGQMALDSVVSFFQSALREMDMLARLSDGEFIALLPGSTRAEAAQVTRRMQAAMSQCVIPLHDQQLRLQFLHGLAEVKPHETAQLLIARAKSESRITTGDPA